ncbi:MAG: cyclophilin-like fold protein [Candidatus Altiarchaeota archaeon]
MKIKIILGEVSLSAVLNDSETAKAIYGALPFESGYSRWGDEIYFQVPVQRPLEDPREVVEVGDLAFWPSGSCFCIFYGKTPASMGDEIRPASAVNVFGRIHGDSSILKTVSSHNIRIDKI